MAPSIDIRSLQYRYFDGARPALNDITLHIPGGSCVALLGSAGAGKTTLLQILSGIIGAQVTTGQADGSISIGDEVHRPIPSRVLFPSVGYLMQDASLQLSGIKETVEEELGFTMDNLGISGDDRRTRISDMLARLDIAHLGTRRPSRLSGGELQRVALASILVANPSLLLLDEPVNALDSLAEHRMTNILRSLSGSTTIMLSDPGIAFSLSVADTYAVLDEGRLVFFGSRKEFLRSLETFSRQLPVSSWDELLRNSGKVNNQKIARFFTV